MPVVLGEVARALLGLGVAGLAVWLLSEARRDFPLRPLAVGFGMAVALAILLTRVPQATIVFAAIAHGVNGLQAAATAGAVFVFGYLAGGPQPFAAKAPFIFALQALPPIILVSGLSALLWHWGLLRWLVQGAGRLFGLLFGVSGAVGVSASACIFLGMVEAPLLIRPLIPKMSRGEIFIIMVDGLSVLAGSNMVFLGAILNQRFPGAFTHFLTASLVTTPLAIGIARAIIPAAANTRDVLMLETQYRSGLDALTQGTLNGARMAVAVAALLIVFVGIMALVDQGLALLPHQGAPLALRDILGFLFAPVAWLMGVPSPDIPNVAALLGTRVSVNEVVAYSLFAAPGFVLSAKASLIALYALCSFGNIGSVAILVGALSAMAPERAGEIAPLGLRALLAAFLASCVTGTIIGLVAP